MKILQIEQNTPGWEAMRRTLIGASDCPAICSVDPYKKPEKLFRQKCFGEKQWVSPYMERGKKLEPIVRERYEKIYGKPLSPVVGIHNSIDYMMASFDGYDPSTGLIIEIKCPSEKNFDKIVLDGVIPIQYIYQMQHQMKVAEASKALLIPFNGVYFEEIWVERDEDIIQEIIEKERHFYDCLIYGEYK